MEKDISRKTNFEESENRPALRAANFFRQASIKYPASVPAQAAEIALVSRRQDFDPAHLWSRLQEDKQEMEKLAQDANRAHKFSEQTPEVTSKMVESIAGQVFLYADRMMALNNDELTRICNAYRLLSIGVMDRYEHRSMALELLENAEIRKNK